MSTRMILNVFEQFERARLTFVQTIADLAARPCNLPCLISVGAIPVLTSLIKDKNCSIAQFAVMGLARLANNSQKVALDIIHENVLGTVLCNPDTHTVHFKRAVLLLCRSIAKHNIELATVIQKCGGMDYAMTCLNDFDATVKEGAMCVIANIAKHTAELAKMCVDKGCVPGIVLCLQQPEMSLKQAAIICICEIAKHNAELASVVCDSGVIFYLAKALNNHDAKVKRGVLSSLGQIAGHSVRLAEACIEAEIFPEALQALMHEDYRVKGSAATLIKNIAKQSVELAQLIVNSGGIGPLIELVAFPNAEVQVPAIMALGYIAGQSEQLALTIISCKGVIQLAIVLNGDNPDQVLSSASWTLGNIGKHTPEHSNNIALANVFPRMVQLHVNGKSSEDLQNKCKCSLKLCLQKCLHLPALEPLLYDAPPSILKYILGQYSKVLPHDPAARRLFVTTGGLKKIQEIPAEPGSSLMDYIANINACFPDEVIMYLTPGYAENLLEKVDNYTPQVPPLFLEDNGSDTCAEYQKTTKSP